MKKFLYFSASFLLFFACKEKVREQKEQAKSREEILVDSLNDAALKTMGQNPERARGIAEIARQKAVKFGYRRGEADGLRHIGTSWRRQGGHDSALANYHKSLTICREIGDAEGEAKISNNLGTVFEDRGDYEKAMTHLQNSLGFFETKKDSLRVALIINNLGRIFTKQKNYKKALEIYRQGLVITENLLRHDSENNSYLAAKMSLISNVGIVFNDINQIDTALVYYLEHKRLAENLQDTINLADAYNSIGRVYHRQKDYPKALMYYQNGRDLAQKIGDKLLVCQTKINISQVKVALSRFADAEEEFYESLKIAEEIGNKKLIVENLQELAELTKNQRRFEESVKFFDRAFVLRDSVLSEASAQAVAQMATIYETEKKERQIELLNKEQALKDQRLDRQRLGIILAIFIALAVIVFAIFLFRANRAKQKANHLLSRQKDEIEKQKTEIERKTKEISDSINYAKRIQEAILPPLAEIAKTFPQSFVLYQPKDIVSGDFYWFYKKDKEVLIAAADCTGHGVPGAFMSMISAETLNEAVKQTQNPSEILSFVNRAIKHSLRQSTDGESTRDGMDIALVKLNLATRAVEYAGANRPLWIIRKEKTELEEIKATKKAIAGPTDDDQVYDLHCFELARHDTLYLFSDGYADQFGGPKGKKLMTARLKELLVLVKDLPMDDKRAFLSRHLSEWRNAPDGTVYEQVDDILVIGIRV